MNDLSDLDKQIEQLRRCEIIKENDVKSLCAKAREILGKQASVSSSELTCLAFSGGEQRPED